ncbi:hypothetical protein EDB92DRAFT_1883556 [Lactarius akahatsu]|uniref:Secreted protein n=1 Tax=Lactarius akahatsu TaxID=416441 RepID=A0AAD4QAU6_9AGAM|nr:hypothetical protein EDB92DRAFT_1883556 [Lactarius akahatsu]
MMHAGFAPPGLGFGFFACVLTFCSCHTAHTMSFSRPEICSPITEHPSPSHKHFFSHANLDSISLSQQTRHLQIRSMDVTSSTSSPLSSFHQYGGVEFRNEKEPCFCLFGFRGDARRGSCCNSLSHFPSESSSSNKVKSSVKKDICPAVRSRGGNSGSLVSTPANVPMARAHLSRQVLSQLKGPSSSKVSTP